MLLPRFITVLALAIAAAATHAIDDVGDQWDRDAGKPAPRLVATGWLGAPVSLDALKGNTVVLAFWNLDVPWC